MPASRLREGYAAPAGDLVGLLKRQAVDLPARGKDDPPRDGVIASVSPVGGGMGPLRFERKSTAPQAARIPSYPTDPWEKAGCERRMSVPLLNRLAAGGSAREPSGERA